MEVIYHGHSFVEILFDGKSILIDPFVIGNNNCDLTIESLIKKKIDKILVTHSHNDHIGDTIVLLQSSSDIQVVCSFDVMREVVSGIEDDEIKKMFFPMHIGGERDFGYFKLKLVNAVHSNGACGFLITIGEKLVYHAGDTALHSDMTLLSTKKIDLAFLPIGDRFTMGIGDAVCAVNMIKSKIVVPMHYNTRDYIKKDAMEFAKLVMQNGVTVPKVLSKGQYIVL